jgi:NAD(P)-dependent dehydrogenase (short-subunit alcohol dehydrogenase family)
VSVLDRVFSLNGQVAVVTGSARGLGRVFACALAGAGADIALIDLDAAGMEETAALVRSTGRRAYPFTADVSDEAQVAAAFAGIDAAAGRLDILVNNAGIGEAHRGMVHEYPAQAWRRMIDVNLNSVFYCSREALKRMHARRKGKIINIASMWGLVGAAFVSAPGYAASKGAVVDLTREMALEYAPLNIQINAICPGFHRTGLGNSGSPEFIRLMERHTPAARVADPAELQGTIIHLASSASDFMCGSLVVVDGGFLAQ